MTEAMRHLIPSHQARPADDPIFALNREATERRQRGEAVVNATVGALLDDEGKLSVLPTATRVLREVDAEDFAAYAPIAGLPPFLSAVVDDVFEGHHALRDVAVASATPGGTGALRHAINNYLEPGHALLTTSSYWGPYKTLCDESDRTLATFRMFGGDGALDVAALEQRVDELLASQGRVLLFLNDPCHNPTGYSMQRGEWERVAEVLAGASKRGPVTLLVDMAYSEYGPGDARDLFAPLTPHLGSLGLLVAWSASKSFTHYGLRVGALVAAVPDRAERESTAAALSFSSRGTWSNCNRGGMVAITRLLTDPALASACDGERLALTKTLFARVAAFNELARPKGLVYPRYEGGFFVTVFDEDAERRAARMREAGVFVVPSKGALRVALCSVAERDVARLVEALAS